MTSTVDTYPRVISYGGGLDSFTMLLGAIERNIPIDACVFCDVADPQHLDPGEWPGTYRHTEQVVKPICAEHGIPFVWLHTDRYPIRHSRSLFAYFEAKQRIPGANRMCTVAAKIERFRTWLDEQYPGQEVEVWIGFDATETSRAANDPHGKKSDGAPKAHRRTRIMHAVRRNRFPLMEWEMCRCRCEAYGRASGHPVPRKSACCFCPHASKGDWQTLARELPATFERIADLEANVRVTEAGYKLTIMEWRNGRGTALRDFVAKPYKARKIPCSLCGAEQRATKATACGWLDGEPCDNAFAWTDDQIDAELEGACA
jgi:hypothetical protein